MFRLTLPLAILFLFTSSVAAAYPAQSMVTVNVFYPDGSPAANVAVALQNGGYAILGNGTTDAAGTCAFNVSPVSSVLRAIVPGHNVTSVWYEAGNTTIYVKLPRVGEVTGTVKLDGMGSGNPLVVLDDEEIFDSTPFDVSRQNGIDVYTFTVNRFSLQTSVGPHEIYAIGYWNDTVFRSGRVAINVSETNTPLVLELVRTDENASSLPADVYDRIFHTSNPRGSPLSFTGRLVDSGGAPILNATLTAQDYFIMDRGSAVSGANGTFVFGLLNVSTDFLRFKVAIPDNGSMLTTYTQFYPAENTSGLEVRVLDYPKPVYGYIYGIIALTDNRSHPVPISGTVYLSNGIVQEVSPSINGGQFSFALAPGTYEIYAVHEESGRRLVSGKRSIDVQATWSALAVNPTVLVVEPEKVQYAPLLIALVLGGLCLAGVRYAINRWL